MNQITKIITLAIISILLVSCSNSNEQLSISELTKTLESKGMKVSNKSEMMFQLIMASDGYSIDINGEGIEIYQFDTTIKSGREALDKLKKEGFMGQKIIAHKNLVIFQNIKHEKWNDILNILKEL